MKEKNMQDDTMLDIVQLQMLPEEQPRDLAAICQETDDFGTPLCLPEPFLTT
jgi:hypothetical protein